MLAPRKENLSALGAKSKGDTAIFAPKSKGTTLNSTPALNPALKALAFNKRKHFKLG